MSEALNPRWIRVYECPDFALDINPPEQLMAIVFLKEGQNGRGIAMTMHAYREAHASLEKAYSLYNWQRDTALEFLTSMIDPENQPPQYTPDEIWKRYQEIMTEEKWKPIA